MKLTQEDHNWLEAYRQTLAQQFPGMVEHIILFGSKARGTATEESDFDLLVVIRRGDAVDPRFLNGVTANFEAWSRQGQRHSS